MRSVLVHALAARLAEVFLDRLALLFAPPLECCAACVVQEHAAVNAHLVVGFLKTDRQVHVFVAVHEILVPSPELFEDVAANQKAKTG